VDRQAGGYGHGSDGRGGGWAGLRQVVNVRITREALAPGQEVIVEDHYYLTSLAPERANGDPEALLGLARGHWEVENRLHHRKDRSLGEDADRTRRGAGVMARLRSLAVGLLEHVAGDSIPQKQIRISTRPSIGLKLLTRKRFRKPAPRL